MMRTKYGIFTDHAVKQYKTKLHKKLFWLLLYKDPKTAEKYEYVDYDRYFELLMKELCGLEDLVENGAGQLIELMSLLQAAKNEANQEDFNYATYRKFVLDAHAVLDRITFGDNLAG